MKRALENFKSVVLTILIILSLFLTGSLWFDNYQGLSLLASSMYASMIDSLSNDGENSIVYDKIIVPYKVTVVDPDKNKWIFYETDSMNINAWDITKNRLDSLTSDSEIITGQVKEWDSLFTRKSIILEFGGSIENDILRLAIPNLPKETNAFNNVEKIAITKSLEGNTIYILQNDGKKKSLYKVLLKGQDQEIETFMDNCENVKSAVKYVELEKVGTTKFFNNKEVTNQNGVLFPVYNISTHRDTIRPIHTVPYFNMDDEYGMNRFIIDIFSNTDFAKFVTNDESNIFINDDKSSIKFEKNGVVEYINNSKLEGEVTSASKNFNTAMNFINNMRVYDSVYLLSAKEEDGLYTFKFSVAYDGVMLGLKNPIIDDEMYSIIEVQAKEDSIRYFKGKLLDIELNNNSAYVSSFTHNILDNVLKNIKSGTTVKVSLVEMLYIVDEPGTYYPNWVVKYNEKKSDEENISLTYTIKR